MRVLWFSLNPSMYDEAIYGGWVSSLERAFRIYAKDVELGIAFEYVNDACKKKRGNVTYYPIKKFSNRLDKLRWQIDSNMNWTLLKDKCLRIINEFKPDVIQCFGSEWDWGLIANETKIPVVIHMQGFLNIYTLSSHYTLRYFDYFKFYHYNPIQLFRYKYREVKNKQSLERELKIMQMNRYFLGRTKWDKDIVCHFGQSAKYFHCDEVIRPEIYDSPKRWEFSNRDKIKLLTVSSASGLKGNGLILQTANILKWMNVDYSWSVAGDRNTFSLFESITGLNHNNLNINLIGKINANQIVDEICDSDFFVQTSIIDNSPNALCEAQLLGIPVITTYVGGIPSLVDDSQTGFFFPYNEPYALAYKILELHGKQQLLEYVSNNEYEISHKRHNPQIIVQNLCNIYNEIIIEEQNKN